MDNGLTTTKTVSVSLTKMETDSSTQRMRLHSITLKLNTLATRLTSTEVLEITTYSSTAMDWFKAEALT